MVDVIALIAEKRKAVEEENFERAAEIKKELDTVDVTALAAEKAQAVADENYMRAAELKKIIESLTIESHSSSSGDPSSSPTKLSSSPSPSKTPTASNNPIKSDPYLSALIGSLDDIQNHKQFKKWRSSFLEKFESFLSQEGSKPAQTAYDNFRKHMVSFVKKVTAVEKFVEKGDISVERTTVKGRNSLNELDKQLKEIILDCAELIPSTNAEETKRGYTKFHLGAVLVRDGFKEHERLTKSSEVLTALATDLKEISDKQQLDEFANFATALNKFQDIMADLGLFDVMQAAFSFADPGDEFIFVDIKTGAIGVVDIKSCLEKGLIHTVTDDKGNDVAYKESIKDAEDKEAILEMVRETLKA